MQAVKDHYQNALDHTEFQVTLDRHSSGIEVEVLSDSTLEVIPHIAPPRVGKISILYTHP